MSSIPDQSAMAGVSNQQNALQDAQFASYMRKQSVSAYESLDAGLTIKTKDGDLVTLTSNSYAQFDASMYNSKGVFLSDSEKLLVTHNQREITLTSGESFSFSVVGDLGEEELDDIEAIVKGIDEIISEMAKGDMDDAVALALSMGGYDTVSMYSADITYQKSYAMTSETQVQQAQAETVKAMPEPELLPVEENPIPSVKEPFPENHRPRKKKNNTIENIDKFVERMAKEMEKIDEKLIDKAQKPIDKLFRRHLRGMKKNHGDDVSTYNAIENAQKQIEKMIDKMASKIFKNHFSALL